VLADELKIEWVKIKIEEYKTLRAEVLNSGNNSISILRYGLIAISGLIYFGLTNIDNVLTSNLIFLLFCPVICYLILMIWVGEIARRFRASSYIHDYIEKEVNKCFEDLGPVLHWEKWLRGENEKDHRKRLFKWHRAATVSLFFITAGCSAFTGIYKNQNVFTQLQFDLIFYSEAIFIVGVALFVLSVYKKLNLW